MSAESAAPYAIPHAVVSKIGSSRRCICIVTRLPPVAMSAAPSPSAIPVAAFPPFCAARISGRKSSTTPPTPSDAPTRARRVIGVPNASRAPTRLMNTIVENSTATSPEATYSSAR